MCYTEKPSPTFNRHLAAIKAGEVTRTNIIGIRKLLNAAAAAVDDRGQGLHPADHRDHDDRGRIPASLAANPVPGDAGGARG